MDECEKVEKEKIISQKWIKIVTKWFLKITYPAAQDTVLSEESYFPHSAVGCQSILIVPNLCFPTVESCSYSPAEGSQQCRQHFHRNRVKCHSLPQQKQINKVQYFILRSNQVHLFNQDKKCLVKFPALWDGYHTNHSNTPIPGNSLRCSKFCPYIISDEQEAKYSKIILLLFPTEGTC